MGQFFIYFLICYGKSFTLSSEKKIRDTPIWRPRAPFWPYFLLGARWDHISNPTISHYVLNVIFEKIFENCLLKTLLNSKFAITLRFFFASSVTLRHQVLYTDMDTPYGVFVKNLSTVRSISFSCQKKICKIQKLIPFLEIIGYYTKF